MSERELALERVNAALPVLKQINELYLTAVNINQKGMAQKVQAERSRIRSVKTYPAIGAIVAFVLLDIIYSLVVARIASVLPSLIGSILAIVYIIFAIIVCAVVYQTVKAQVRVGTVSPATPKYRQEIDEISDEIYRLTVANEAVIAQIPRDYRYYDAAAYFEHVLANEQADSMKEAINLFEEYLHRQRLEQNSAILLDQAQRQSQMLSNIERSSKETTQNSGIAAAFSILNYLK